MIQAHHRCFGVGVNCHGEEPWGYFSNRGIGSEEASEDFRVSAAEHYLGPKPADKLGDGNWVCVLHGFYSPSGVTFPLPAAMYRSRGIAGLEVTLNSAPYRSLFRLIL